MNSISVCTDGARLSSSSQMPFLYNFKLPNACSICNERFPKPKTLCYFSKFGDNERYITHASYYQHPFRNVPTEKTTKDAVSFTKVCSSTSHLDFHCECICSDMQVQEFLDLHPDFFYNLVEESKNHDSNHYKRVCSACYNKVIEEALQKDFFVFNKWGDYCLKCPFCEKGHIKAYAYLDDKNLADICEKLGELRKKQMQKEFYCPVTMCNHSEVVLSTSFTKCPTHGSHCIKCWEKITQDTHVCLGIPKVIADYDKKHDFVCCPRCNLLQEHESGCKTLQCGRCRKYFDKNILFS